MDKFMNTLKDLNYRKNKSTDISTKSNEENEYKKTEEILAIGNISNDRDYYPNNKSSGYCLGNKFTRNGKKIKD